MTIYSRFVAPMLFRTDAECMHDRAISAAERASRSRACCSLIRAMLAIEDPSLAVDLGDLQFRHPVGLAAGFDKNGRGAPLWEAFGFSHVEIGSVSAHFSAGNSKPRLFRLPQDRAIVVNYGLPNEGADRVAQRLADIRPRLRTPLGVNIVNTNRGAGAKAESNDEIIADYVASVARLQEHASYLVLNLSCPNTCDGRAFVSDLGRVRQLLSAVAEVPPEKPLFLKIAPFSDTRSLDAFLMAVDSFDHVRGFSINLPPGKPPGMSAPPDTLATMPGAVSGRPCEAAANRAISEIYTRIDPRRYVVIGSGGVFTAEDVWTKIQLGASLVQCLTGLVFEGPTLISSICRGLARILRREGLRNIQEAVGASKPGA